MLPSIADNIACYIIMSNRRHSSLYQSMVDPFSDEGTDIQQMLVRRQRIKVP